MCILGQESACPPLKRVYLNVFLFYLSYPNVTCQNLILFILKAKNRYVSLTQVQTWTQKYFVLGHQISFLDGGSVRMEHSAPIFRNIYG